jgi:hypothetical protein
MARRWRACPVQARCGLRFGHTNPVRQVRNVRLTEGDPPREMIVREHGWRGRSLIAEEAAQAASLLAQRAGRELDLRREVLPHLERASAAGEAEQTGRVRSLRGICRQRAQRE